MRSMPAPPLPRIAPSGVEFRRVADRFDPPLGRDIGERVAIEIKCEGYVRRQEMTIENAAKTERVAIPDDFDYGGLPRFRAKRAKTVAPAAADARIRRTDSGSHACRLAILGLFVHRARETAARERRRPRTAPGGRGSRNPPGCAVGPLRRARSRSQSLVQPYRGQDLANWSRTARQSDAVPFLTGDAGRRGLGRGLPAIPLACHRRTRHAGRPSARRRAFWNAPWSAGASRRGRDRASEVAAREAGCATLLVRDGARGSPGSTVAELLLPFIASNGVAILQRGSLDDAERAALADAALVLGAEFESEHRRRRSPLHRSFAQKNADAGALSRRSGISRKRPLCM